MKVIIHWPHQFNEFIVNDLHDLLRRIDLLKNLFTAGFLANALHEGFDSFIADISLEQGTFDHAESLTHIRFRKFAAATQGTQCGTQTFSKGFKHNSTFY